MFKTAFFSVADAIRPSGAGAGAGAAEAVVVLGTDVGAAVAVPVGALVAVARGLGAGTAAVEFPDPLCSVKYRVGGVARTSAVAPAIRVIRHRLL